MNSGQQRTPSLFYRVVLPIAILAAGAGGAVGLVAARTDPPRAERIKPAALVSVVAVEQSSERAVISGFGNVQPRRQLTVQPQVSGHIVSLSPQLELGGNVAKDEILLRIDPRDYEIAVEVAKAAVATAEFQYKLEQGNQVIAAREWELLDEKARSSSLARQLALRQPQLKEKEAALDAAKSRLRKAELDLERTKIISPFPAVVLEETAEVGKYVGPQSSVAMLAATDEFYVEVKIPRRELQWLPAAEGMEFSDVPVRVVHDLGDGRSNTRSGRLVRLLGDVDKTGRMVRALAAIPDPLNIKSQSGAQPLLLGSYVKVEIIGREINGGFKLPRRALREGDRVWIYTDDGTLAFRGVELVFAADESVVVRGELQDGDRVVVSSLETPLEGLALELHKNGSAAAVEE